jgi:hypothetical protein
MRTDANTRATHFETAGARLFVFLGAHVLSTLEFRQLLCRDAVAPARLRLKSWLPAGEWV